MHTRTVLQPCKTERRGGISPRARSRMQAPAAATLAASLTLAAGSTAMAGPQGGVVTQGQGSISTPNAGTTVIDCVGAPRVIVELCCSTKLPARPSSAPRTVSIAT